MNKNILIATILMFLIFSVVTLAYEEPPGDTVNINISSNGTFDSNIEINATDTGVRDDVYGSASQDTTGPKDETFEYIINEANESIPITQVCSGFQSLLNDLSAAPPSEFINYLKSLGYDDETHINMIWSVCQQQYINQNEGQWSTDLVGGGLQPEGLAYYIQGAINWLLGKEGTPDEFKEIGTALESYFASDKELRYYVQALNDRISFLELRLETLENTMEDVAAEAYCQAKIAALKEYNLTYVKCGKNSTVYTNVNPGDFNGYDLIGYTINPECQENWECTDWSECKDGMRERTCEDVNECGTTKNKPSESQACIIIIQEVTETQEPTLTGSFILTQGRIYNLFSSIKDFLLSEIVYIPGQGFSIR